jgi:hypothetical protein
MPSLWISLWMARWKHFQTQGIITDVLWMTKES